jgi:cell division inhibitor SulA
MPISISNGQVSGSIDHTAGWETLPLAGIASIDLNADGNTLGWDSPAELGLGGVVVYSVFNGVLTGLQLEPFVRSKVLSRQDQWSAVWSAMGDSVKNNWLKIAAITVVLSLLPGLTPIVGVASIFGGVFMGDKLVRSFWIALSDDQRTQLTTAAKNAGVKLPVPSADNPTSTGTAAGYGADEPLPVMG